MLRVDALFLAVLLGSCMRRDDTVNAGMVNLFRTGSYFCPRYMFIVS